MNQAQPSLPKGDIPHPPWVKWGLLLSWRQGTLTFIAILTLARVWLLFIAPFDLGPDEAQYWSWSRDFAFGYFSKPPMLAWVIGATTAACGLGEACVRLASPFFHGFTALMLFILARNMFDDRVGFWTGVLYVTLPGVWFSSGLITTDVPLLFFWSMALVALWCLREERALKWAVLLGLGIGLGLMSKYAMLYFIIGAGLACFVDKQTRRAVLSPYGALAGAIGVALLAPNMWWNAAHDFSTVTHTAANANWGADLFNLDEMLDFLGGQFGIFGPFLFGALLFALVGFVFAWRRKESIDFRLLWLASFSVPALSVGIVQSFISRANANWAATAYVAAIVLVVAWLLKSRAKPLLPASFVLHNVFGLLLVCVVIWPSLITTLGRSNDFKRVRGWEEIGKFVEVRANEGLGEQSFTAVMVNDRLTFGELLYYAPDLEAPLTMWDDNGIPENHFELTSPITTDLDDLILFVGRGDYALEIATTFEWATPLDPLVVEIGGGRTRSYHLYALSGIQGPAATE